MPLPEISCIESDRLRLVPPAASHLDDLQRVNGDDAVTRFLPYESWRTREDGHSWLARMQALAEAGTGRQLVLLARADGRAIGTLLLFRHDGSSARVEVGYALARAQWGRGLMREAVAAACAHAFDALQIRRIEAEVNPANHASCRLLHEIGFVLEGTLRQRWVGKGAAYDTQIHGLLADDWRRACGRAG
jgi:ribosomal-protein-alanine N-acetyltransferase